MEAAVVVVAVWAAAAAVWAAVVAVVAVAAECSIRVKAALS